MLETSELQGMHGPGGSAKAATPPSRPASRMLLLTLRALAERLEPSRTDSGSIASVTLSTGVPERGHRSIARLRHAPCSVSFRSPRLRLSHGLSLHWNEHGGE
jgi:hypothetical protein